MFIAGKIVKLVILKVESLLEMGPDWQKFQKKTY